MKSATSWTSAKKAASTSVSGQVPVVKPLWTIDTTNEEEIVQWFTDTVQELESNHNDLVAAQDRNREFFFGIQSAVTGNVARYRRYEDQYNISQSPFARVVINRIYNLIELWVAKLTRFSPNVVVNPANTEYSDRVSAKLGKLIADNIGYINNVEDLVEEVVRISRIDGETYVFADWDKNIGDYKKEVIEAQKKGIKRPIVDSEGNPVVDEEGKPLYDEKKEKIGDVKFNQVDSRFIILEPREKYADSDWLIRIKVRYVDDVKSEFPDKADKVQAGFVGPFNFNWIQLSEHETIEYTIYHRSHPQLDEGLEIRMLADTVLSVGPYSCKSAKDKLPCVRYSCIDIPGVQRGVSILNNLMVVQVLLNNVFSIGYTNYALGAHAYWLVPTQANVSLDKLKNGASVIRFTGPQGPKLETFNTLDGSFFRMLEFLDNWLVQISGHQGISQGDPPPGVDAAVAMGVLEEQENQRANPEIKKYNSFIRKLFILALARAQDNYKTSDGRLARIVGKNGQDTMKAIDMAKFAGSYDVRVTRSTALSESKSLRLQQLMLMKQNFPNAISDRQFLDLMEMGDETKFFDITAASVRAADAENEKFFSKEYVLDPADYEQHVAHLDVHYPFMSTLSFKEDMEPEQQQEFFAHVLTHEHLAYEQCWSNLTQLQELMTKPEYPRFFKIPIPLVQVMQFVQNGVSYEQALFTKNQELNNIGMAQPQLPMAPSSPAAQPSNEGPPQPQAPTAPQALAPNDPSEAIAAVEEPDELEAGMGGNRIPPQMETPQEIAP